MTAEAAQLERGWRLAESRAPAGPDAVSADPLEILIGGEPILVGVDRAGARHLLIPIPSDAVVAIDSSGTAVALRKRSLMAEGKKKVYADLSCSRPDLFDHFAVLCADVLATLTGTAVEVPEKVIQVLNSWRELLNSLSPPQLNRSGVIGLYAELSVLERIQGLDARKAIDSWTGPSRGRYDFQRGHIVLEVKGSVARRGRPIRVHGLDQLEEPPNASLYLWWVRLEVGVERGESLSAQVNRLLDGCLNRPELEQKLRNVGYSFESEHVYETPLMTELERRLYRVDSDFPRLTRKNLVGAELPRGVLSVSYEVDLAGDLPEPVGAVDEGNMIAALAGR